MSAQRPLLLAELEQIAVVAFGAGILDSISSRQRAVLMVNGVLGGFDGGASTAEADAVRRAAVALFSPGGSTGGDRRVGEANPPAPSPATLQLTSSSGTAPPCPTGPGERGPGGDA